MPLPDNPSDWPVSAYDLHTVVEKRTKHLVAWNLSGDVNCRSTTSMDAALKAAAPIAKHWGVRVVVMQATHIVQPNGEVETL